MKSKKGEDGITIVVFLISIIILLMLGLYSLVYAFISGSETITIEEKWEKVSSKNSKYLVSSTNEQVFEISDSWIKGRWDSSNLYAKLKPGQTCKIETQGWRFGFMSDYKNIITADCTNSSNI